MKRKPIIVVAVMVVMVAAIVIGIKAFTAPGAPGGMPEHIIVAQAMADGSGTVVKVGGDIVPGSISWDNASGSLRFTLTGGGASMPVVYRGLAPGEFKPGLALVVEGVYAAGVFEATSLTITTSPLCKTCHSG